MKFFNKSFILSLTFTLLLANTSFAAPSSLKNIQSDLSKSVINQTNDEKQKKSTGSAKDSSSDNVKSVNLDKTNEAAWALLSNGFENQDKDSLLKALDLYEKLVGASDRSGKYLTYLGRCYTELLKLDPSNTEYQQKALDLYSEALPKLEEQPDATNSVTTDGIKQLVSETNKATKPSGGNLISKFLDVARKYINNRDFHTSESWSITQHGNVSCAYFVSYVLKEAGILPRVEYNVDNLITLLLDTGMFTKTPAPPYQTGDVILWEDTSHVGFIDEDGDSIDNSSSAGMPKKRGVWGSQEPYVLRINS